MIIKEIQITTNGKYYPKLALEALKDYHEYCLINKIGTPGYNVGFSFSIDPFHENIFSEQKTEVRKQYFSNYPQFIYINKLLDSPYKTGKCNYGEEFIYQIEPIYVACNPAKNYIMTSDTLYVTAKGNYETVGDGSYQDMDKINMGSVYEKSLLDLIEEYGKDINGDNKTLKRVITFQKNQ